MRKLIFSFEGVFSYFLHKGVGRDINLVFCFEMWEQASGYFLSFRQGLPLKQGSPPQNTLVLQTTKYPIP